MNEIIMAEDVKIEDMIHVIRGIQIILSSDVARIYNSEVRIINQIVKRNIKRFPGNFCFQLTSDEYEYLKSQNVISKSTYANHGGNRHLPYAFTEHGVIMLSGLLKSDIACQVNISVINAFVAMKKYISNNLLEQEFINEMVIKDNKRLDLIEETLEGFKEKNNHIFFDGQIYDAYSVMLDIINKSKKSIVIIDNYLDKNLLDILCKTDKEILVITSSYNKNDFNKYMEEYDNVTIKLMDNIHDRFIIIDNNLFYNFGASFKDLGKKCFSINKIEDKDSLNKLINYII